MINIQTREKRIRGPREVNNGPVLVETAGYISKNRRIQIMMQAGKRLVEIRKEMFDYYDKEVPEDPPIDPTRAGNYDLADASQYLNDHIVRKEVFRKKRADLREAREKARSVAAAGLKNDPGEGSGAI